MTASAITATAPTPTRAGLRNAARADEAESPFASLIGAGSEPERPASSPARAEVGNGDGDDDRKTDAATEGEAGTAARADALPAWLLALRTLAPETVPAGSAGAAAVASPTGDAGLAGAADKTGLGLTPLPVDRLLKLRGLETPPTQAPPLPPTDGASTTLAAAADPAAAAPLPAPTAEVALDASQTAALDAALGKAGVAGELPELTPVAVSAPAERAPAAPVVATAAATDAAAAVPTATPLTDAFGETLALDGRDAALRLGERLRWLTESGVHEARLKLHPRELGSVDIRIRIEGQGASVWFGADHPAARAALESTLPQLRQQLAAEGFSLGQAQVGQSGTERGPGQQAGQGDGRGAAPFAAAAAGRRDAGPERGDDGPRERPVASARSARGLVDRYA